MLNAVTCRACIHIYMFVINTAEFYLGVSDALGGAGQVPVAVGAADVGCAGVGGGGARGGAAGTADHAGVAAAGPAHAAGAGAAVAAALPAVPGAARPLTGAVLPDVASHLGGGDGGVSRPGTIGKITPSSVWGVGLRLDKMY